MSEVEEPMPGGVANAGQVVRVGDTVRRPAGPQSPAVQAFLAHLHARGFDGAPRPLGFDEQGREMLTYVPGDVPHHEVPPGWCLGEDVLLDVVALTRAMHEAGRGFVPPPGAQWSWPPAAEHRTDVIGHNDLCRENVVFRDGRPVAFVDFDFAGPSSPEWDMAGVLRHWVLGLPGDRVARARLAVEAYPLDPARVTHALLGRLEWGIALVRARAAAGEPGFVAMWESGIEQANLDRRAWVREHLPG